METAVAATFRYRHEAEFARETLRASGVESVLIADDAGGAYAGMSFSRPVRLLVRVQDLAEAREILGADPGADDDDGAVDLGLDDEDEPDETEYDE
jgi:hypothetical protein